MSGVPGSGWPSDAGNGRMEATAGGAGDVEGWAGERVVRTDLVATVVFAVLTAAGLAAGPLRVVTAVGAPVLFAAGVACFIWSYVTALERSRTDEVGVANLYLLTGSTAPRPVKRRMLGSMLVQIVTALAGAGAGFARLDADELNPLAFGILVPMFGLGLNGLWASRHGAFGPRILNRPAGRRRAATDPEQTSDHG